MQHFSILRWLSKKNLKYIYLPLATIPNFIKVHEKKACTVKRKIQDFKWMITEVRSSLNCLHLNSPHSGRGPRPWAVCTGVLRIMEPKGEFLSMTHKRLFLQLMWVSVIQSEHSCDYCFLTAEKYWSGSIKGTKQISICVKIAEHGSSFVHCVLLAWFLEHTDVPVHTHPSAVFCVLLCFQLSFWFQQTLLF